MTKFTFQLTVDYNEKTKNCVVHTTSHSKVLHLSPVRSVKRPVNRSAVSNVVTRGSARTRQPPNRLINEAN